MLFSKMVGDRYRETPADVMLLSHKLLIKGGYIKKVGNGIYSLMPIACKIARKIEAIIREEMDAIGAQEVLLPVTAPAELWERSGRYESIGDELVRFEDRFGHRMVLSMTNEEAAVALVAPDASSYTKYPIAIYQIQTKFRDEARSRGGLIRVREFVMKDAYSFHTTQADLDNFYEECFQAYQRIFTRVGLKKFVAVGSDTGMMGGTGAHEFMELCDDGEDTLVLCSHCGYQENQEVATQTPEVFDGGYGELQEVYTPHTKDIESLAAFLKIDKRKTAKAVIFLAEGLNKPVIAFTRGDCEVSEAKLRKVVGANLLPLSDSENEFGLCYGFIGAKGLDSGKYIIVADRMLQEEHSVVCGANKEDYHLTGVCLERDCGITQFYDIVKVAEGSLCPQCQQPLHLQNGIEIGNIFKLGTKYTQSMGMTYTDEEGKEQTPLMGCYGIGVGRLLACLIEEHGDEYGPSWPAAVAPFAVHICAINNAKQAVHEASFALYETLQQNGLQTLLDDRNVSAGVQFADADLIGAPLRVVVSERNLNAGVFEVSTRDKTVQEKVPMDEIVAVLQKLLARD